MEPTTASACGARRGVKNRGLSPISQRSKRHKAGLTVRFPRIARWRQDLAPDAADRLADVEALVDE